MHLLGVVGSLREGSYNAQLMDVAGGLLPAGVHLTVFEGLKDLPPFDQAQNSTEAPPAPVETFITALREADGVLFATPEYNGSIPGTLKNALDWASVPFEHNVLRNKPVAVTGTSTGMFGAVWAQAELRKVLGLIGARVLDRDTPVPLAELSFADGLDPEFVEALTATIADLVELISERDRALAER